MCGSRDMRDLFQQIHVLRVAAELVISDQHAVGGAAEGAVLFFVDLLEQRALVELGRRLEVLDQVLLGRIQHVDFHVGAGLGLIGQIFQTAPGSLELLELAGVHDFIELIGQQGIDFRDTRVEDRDQVLARRDFAFEHLVDQLVDQVAGPGALGFRTRHAAFGNDAVQQ